MLGICAAVKATTSQRGSSRNTTLKLWKSRPAAPRIRILVRSMEEQRSDQPSARPSPRRTPGPSLRFWIPAFAGMTDALVTPADAGAQSATPADAGVQSGTWIPAPDEKCLG